jgi:hypothetical protein
MRSRKKGAKAAELFLGWKLEARKKEAHLQKTGR